MNYFSQIIFHLFTENKHSVTTVTDKVIGNVLGGISLILKLYYIKTAFIIVNL